jgi:hypothetical protein
VASLFILAVVHFTTSAMNPSFFLTVTLALLTSLSLSASDGTSLSFIRTNSGKVYTNCRVFKTDPDGVIIAHQSGGAKLLFADLPEDTRAMLGYDAKKAAAYEKDRAEAKAKEREELWKYRREVAKAQAAAYAAEAKRMEVIAVQNLAMGYGGYGWDGIHGLGWNPAYGYANGFANGINCRPPFLHFNRGRTTLPATSTGAPVLNVRGRTIFGPAPHAVPLATPAMGPLTPGLGTAGVR